MPTPKPIALRRLSLTLAACVIAVALAACGSSSNSNAPAKGSGPAVAVPSAALLYLEADIHPGGSLLQNIDAASQRLLGISDPGTKLDALLDKAMPSGTSYEQNIRPWLGEQAAIAVLSGPTGQSPQFAFLLDQTNTALANAAVRSGALFRNKNGPPDTVTHASYRGITYTVDTTGGDEVAVVGDYVVLASGTAALDAVVDTVKGAPSLASTSGFKSALDAELPGADGVAYVPLLRLLNAVLASSSTTTASTRQELAKLSTKLAGAILSGSARFDGNGAALDFALSGVAAPSSASGETNPIGTLPGGSWLAIGVTNVGPSLAKLFDELGKLSNSPAIGSLSGSLGSLSSSLAEIRQLTGVNIGGDLSSLTTAAFFAKGTNLATLEAGIVLGVASAGRAATIVTQLKALLELAERSDHAFTIGSLSQSNIQSGFTIHVPDVPFTFDVAAGGARIVIALGTTSLNDALASGGRLSATSTYTTSTSLLGSGIQPDLIVQLPDIGALLTNLGAANSASAAQILPYIEHLGTVALGTGTLGGVEHLRLIVSGS
jgi:hypothetical protein